MQVIHHRRPFYALIGLILLSLSVNLGAISAQDRPQPEPHKKGGITSSSPTSLDRSLNLRVPPDNDDFANATALNPGDLLTITDIQDATTEVGEPVPEAQCTTADTISNSVWFAVNLGEARTVDFDLSASDYDTILRLYTGGPTVTDLSFYPGGCDDDGGAALTSRLVIDLNPGTTYVQVSHWGEPLMGPATLGIDLQIFSKPDAPANDNFADAETVTLGTTLELETVLGASLETGEPQPTCLIGTDEINQTVWYEIDLAADTVLDINLTGSEYDTIIQLYTGGPTVNDLSPVIDGCNDNGGEGLTSRLVTELTTGTYFLQVARWGAVMVDPFKLVMRVSQFEAPEPPPNDDFADATPIAPEPATFFSLLIPDVKGATIEANEPAHECRMGDFGGSLFEPDPGSHSLWFQVTPDIDVTATFTTVLDGTNFDTVMSVYTGESLTNLTSVACNDDAPLSGGSTIGDFALMGGTTYWIQVSRWVIEPAQVEEIRLEFGAEIRLPPVPATTFTVNTTSDTQDILRGDGICADESGACSLRAAITEANLSQPGSTVSIPAGTYTLTQANPMQGEDFIDEELGFAGDFDLFNDMSIVGAGAGETILDGGGLDRLFEVPDLDITVTLSGMTLTNGDPSLDGESQLALGGALLISSLTEDNDGQYADISGDDLIFSQNQSDWVGGAIHVESGSKLALTNSAIVNNNADGYSTIGGTTLGGGGLSVFGGADVELTNVTISGNTAPTGAGLQMVFNTTAVVNNVTIAQNTATTEGGGAYLLINEEFDAPSTLTLSNSLLVENSAPTGPDCLGAPDSTGDNLVSDDSDCILVDKEDIVAPQPRIEPLTIMAPGTTPTHALRSGSPAIDSGRAATCAATDQRGVPRNGICDIGAYEFDGVNEPITFNLLAPSSGAIYVDPSLVPDLTWEKAEDTSLYQVFLLQVSDNARLGLILDRIVLAEDVCVDDVCTLVLTPEERTLLINDGLYSWSVLRENAIEADNSPILFSIDTSGTADLVTNGGFEVSEGGKVPDGWTAKNRSGDKLKCNKPDKVIANSGNCALMFKGRPGENSRFQQVLSGDAVAYLSDANRLTLSAAIDNRSGVADQKVVQVKIVTKNADPKIVKIQLVLPDPASVEGYTLLSESLDLDAPPDKLKIQVRYKRPTGKFFVDDVRLNLGLTGSAFNDVPLLPLPDAPPGLRGG